MTTEDIESSRRVFQAFRTISREFAGLTNAERRRLIEALSIIAGQASGDASNDALAVAAAARVIMGGPVE